MKRAALALSLAVNLAGCGMRHAAEKPGVGLWVVPKSQTDALNERTKALRLQYLFGEPDPFYYDGTTVTLRLLSDVLRLNAPKDEIYRLTARWTGDDLYCELPFSGAWQHLARFREGHFEAEQTTDAPAIGTIVWRFDRTPVEQAPEWSRALLRKRSVWKRPAR